MRLFAADAMGKAYVKSMRMEEKYHECSAAMEGLEASTVWGAQWCNNERAVLRKLVGCKDSGDSLFRKGDYLAAVSSYGAGISLFAQNEKGKVRLCEDRQVANGVVRSEETEL